MDKTVIELFAGVGGFRVGFNDVKKVNAKGKAAEKKNYKFVWANQWEPSTKAQPAYDCYKTRFDDKISNLDISLVNKAEIPDHTILCGGFPCQDYSVARSLSNEKGIEGKKGVLWWQINDILGAKKPFFVLLENVDRLIKAPSKQRGRDFGIMLRCFYEKGYDVEWRVINAADYGHPQRRRRIYIFAYRNDSNYYSQKSVISARDIIEKEGIFAKRFPVITTDGKTLKESNIAKYSDLLEISNNYSFLFENSGYMHDGIINTIKTEPVVEKPIPLKKIVEKNVDAKYYLNPKQIEKFKFLRGSKKISRRSKSGHEYIYAEGAMSPFDSLELPGRTMLTSEGTTNRSTHLIKDEDGKFRFLTPIECERLNQFPDNWTNTMSDNKRYFMMGNALVCGIIKKIALELSSIIDREN